MNVFGGGSALYDADGVIVGGLGVGGDRSRADHHIAWKVRHALNPDNVPAGVAPGAPSGTYDIIYGVGGCTHPDCGGGDAAISNTLPIVFPVGPAP